MRNASLLSPKLGSRDLGETCVRRITARSQAILPDVRLRSLHQLLRGVRRLREAACPHGSFSGSSSGSGFNIFTVPRAGELIC